MVSVLAGTPWALPLRGAITLIEEVGERPYAIDRYLTHLTLAGELAKPRAVIVGELVRCVDPQPPAGGDDPATRRSQTVLERLHAAGTPAAVGAPIGHGDRNEPVPFGAAAVLDLDQQTFEITRSRGRVDASSVERRIFVGAELDAAVPLFVSLEVLLQRVQQPLRVTRREITRARTFARPFDRLDEGEVENELVLGVIQQHEVRVDALRDVVVDLNLQLRRGGWLVRHVAQHYLSTEVEPRSTRSATSASGGHQTGQH